MFGLQKARFRHAAHFVNVLRTAEDLYTRGGETTIEGLNLFSLELENIRSAQAWASSLAGSDETAAAFCSDFVSAGNHLLELRQHPRERLHWLQTALEAARQLSRSEIAGGHLGNLGNAYLLLGDTQNAIDHLKESLEFYRAGKDRLGECRVLGSLGNAHANFGEIRRAAELYEQQLVIAHEIGDDRSEGEALGNLGIAYTDLGEPHRAIEFHERSQAIFRRLEDRRGEAIEIDNLGKAAIALGDFPAAIEHYHRALGIYREIGDRYGENNLLGNLGTAYTDMGVRQEASGGNE